MSYIGKQVRVINNDVFCNSTVKVGDVLEVTDEGHQPGAVYTKSACWGYVAGHPDLDPGVVVHYELVEE